jgi:aromatic ring hydroxylase
MITSDEYLKRLAKMRKNIYLDGELIGRDDERILHATHNRFTHIHQSADDLMKKQEMTRKICGVVGGCVQRCMGCDMMNGISVGAKRVDLKCGTSYNENFLKFLEYFQENDLVCAGSQTDTKGDRMARPAEQWDPDQYLRVVERRPDGVVVRGCKAHNTMAPYSDELLVVPTRAMKPDEKDYAISFAIPADAEGVYLIGREARNAKRAENLDAPISKCGDIESMTVFDNVFIPNERIFLNGETELAADFALGFALYHRHSYTGCKPGIGDVLTGTAALLADIQGIAKQSHVKGKLSELISVAELVYAAGMASAMKSTKAESGTQVPDVIFANVGRRHAGHNIFHEFSILTDIAGGLPATLPMSTEYNSPVVGEFVKKYVTRREGVSPETCWRTFALANDLLTGEYSAVLFQAAGVHGGGSPIMEDIAIMGTYDLKSKIALAKSLAGIKD